MRKIFFILSLLFFSPGETRPPEDQILLPPPKQKGMRVIRNKNITYTNEQPEERGGSGPVRTLFTVKGRSRPGREGKVLSQINAKTVVTPFKISKDKKWYAVIVRSSGVRSWIPRTALPPLDSKFRLIEKAEKGPPKKAGSPDEED